MRKSAGYWSRRPNRIAFVAWLGNRLGFDQPDDWYQVTRSDFVQNGGGRLMELYHQSPLAVLEDCLPEHDWKPWLFRRVPKGFWDSLENRHRWVAWFEQQGFGEGAYGVAETLSKAKNTSVSGMVEAGILSSKGGRVCLLGPDELPTNWNPSTDKRLTIWEIVHHLTRALDSGEEQAGRLLAQVRSVSPSKADAARELAYRLYTLCERKKRAQEALAYNALVVAWPELVRLADSAPAATAVQGELI